MAWDGKTFHDKVDEMELYEFMAFMAKEAKELLETCQTLEFGKAMGQSERMSAMFRVGFDKWAR